MRNEVHSSFPVVETIALLLQIARRWLLLARLGGHLRHGELTFVDIFDFALLVLFSDGLSVLILDYLFALANWACHTAFRVDEATFERCFTVHWIHEDNRRLQLPLSGAHRLLLLLQLLNLRQLNSIFLIHFLLFRIIPIVIKVRARICIELSADSMRLCHQVPGSIVLFVILLWLLDLSSLFCRPRIFKERESHRLAARLGLP